MWFKKKKIEIIYHPKDLVDNSEWLICNVLIGVINFKDAGSPISFGTDLEPEWYKNASDEELKATWEAQDNYVERALSWMDANGVSKVFFRGAYQADEKWFLDKYKCVNNELAWQRGLIHDLPKINVHNLYVEGSHGDKLIVYENWDTLFILDVTRTMPAELKEPFKLKMTNQDLLNLHVNEIAKIKFSVLLSIARSEEPLTYTFIDSDKEYQIEVFFNSFSDEGLEMVVGMDSNWEGRFKSSDTTRVVTIRP